MSSIRSQLGIDSDEIRDAFQALVDDGLLRWASKDEVVLSGTSRWSREEWHEGILAVLDANEPMSIHDIASALGKKPENARKYLRQLVDSGEVIATAPKSSTERKYLLRS